MRIMCVHGDTHAARGASNRPIRLSLVVRFAGLDVPVEPAGVGVLPRCLRRFEFLWVVQDRQVLRAELMCASHEYIYIYMYIHNLTDMQLMVHHTERSINIWYASSKQLP